jgi:hypothetical protein
MIWRILAEQKYDGQESVFLRVRALFGFSCALCSRYR